MKAKLCATVTGRTTTELRRKRDAATEADLVELRLDSAREVDVEGVLSGRHCPVVVTCRPEWEGGQFTGSEEERRRLLTRALELGAEYVDVEWRAGFEDAIGSHDGRRIVLSCHDFDGLPGDLDTRAREMRSTGAEVVKIAVHVGRLADLVTLRDFSDRLKSDGQPQVVIGMGPSGIPSRVIPDLFHSSWTYAGEGVAPGQIDLGRMLDEFRFRSIEASSEVFGVLGRPLAHSLSPAMHNAGFEEAGRDAVYLPLEASDVDDFEVFARAFNVRGASVTAPFKAAVVSTLESTDEVSRRVGAVNTIRMDGSRWTGINTDVPGFLAPLESRISLDGCRATVLGAGGAARGVVVALADRGATVTVCARNPKQAASVSALAGGVISEIPPRPGTWDLLVNTTPIGTYPDVETSPMGAAGLGGGLVYDLVYNPPVTKLLADAQAAGCATLGGLGMLVAQAERQFAWWTGVEPGPGTFLGAAQRRLNSEASTAPNQPDEAGLGEGTKG